MKNNAMIDEAMTCDPMLLTTAERIKGNDRCP